MKKELACGFEPGHKVGDEKNQTPQTNAGEILAPAATLQSYSPPPGAPTGAGHRRGSKTRTFTPWSHVVSLLYAQFTHALGLNDVCDGLRLHSGPLSAIRGATPPSKNGLSTANRERTGADGARAVLGRARSICNKLHPGFGGRRRPKFAFRFKRVIHLVDATTIQLVARCLDWAKHRRRKAAAKCHLRLDLQTFLPRFAIVDTAGEHDNPPGARTLRGRAGRGDRDL